MTGRVDNADLEIRRRKSSGESFWAQIWCKATHRDQSGRATFAVGSVTHVSARKVIEERARFAVSAFDTHIPLVIKDAQGTVVQINRAFTDLLKYEVNEIVRHDMRVLRLSKHDVQFYKDMYAHVLAWTRWGGEIRRWRKDGTMEIIDHFSIDDFGTGYSSLLDMRKLPFDEIKIDCSFFADIGTDAEGDAILRTIIQLGLNLNMEVVVEGVESKLQRAFFLENGCAGYQGFLFARLMSGPDLKHLLKALG